MHAQPSAPVIPFTQEAYDQLKRDLAELLEKRAAVMERVKVAREMGDLSENGAYTYGKMELGTVNRELRRVRELLENGKVVTNSGSDTAGFGSTIQLQTSDGKKHDYMLVSIHESNPKLGKLSTESPLGNALMGKKAGDHVSVQVPAGLKEYLILDIH